MPTFGERLKNGWNAFFNNRDPSGFQNDSYNIGPAYSIRPDRIRLTRGNERTIVTAIYNRIAIDVAAIDIKHVRVSENNQFVSEIDSYLNDCLKLDANKDQTGRALRQDIVMTMLDEGVVAIVPIETTANPKKTTSYDILSLRTGKITDWYPDHVRVRIYNDITGQKEDLVFPKSMVAIVENPLYAIMNEPNSTLKRLIHKLNLLDVIDEKNSSKKLDLIVQMPYMIKTDARRQQAESRRKDIEVQLAGSQYGIAYTDGTEKIMQLNRPVENNLMPQIEYLTSMLYSQLGLTDEIMKGTANDATMLNYYNRTIEPILAAITDEMKRKFLTRTARTQKQSIMFFNDPFKLASVTSIAEIADTFTRNEIMTSNEIRGLVGLKPSNQAGADELRNKNLNQSVSQMQMNGYPNEAPLEEEVQEEEYPEEYANDEDYMTEEEYQQLYGQLDDVDADLDELERQVDE